VAQFRESWSRADVVITTGGLGPTCDDRTRECIAEVLGQKLVRNAEIEASIEARFERLGRKMTPNNLKQAQVFERGEVLINANGTAPGLWVEQDGKVLIMLPGPPNELQPMFTEQVVPRLAARQLVLDLKAWGQPLDAIAETCGVSWWTVFRWSRGERVPHPLHTTRLEQFHAAVLAAR
jgi:nicotinamide-nucleotide amidase